MKQQNMNHSNVFSNNNLKQQHQAMIQKWQDRIFQHLTGMFSWVVLLALIGIGVSLFIHAAPVLEKMGLAFLYHHEWNVVDEQFGAIIAITGTLSTSFIAIGLAVPLSFGVAIFLTETAPAWLRPSLGIAIELLAAVPSIIYGMFGLFVFAPWFADWVQIPVQTLIGSMPWVGGWVAGAPTGMGILAAGMVLAFMILPFIASVMRDVFLMVPTPVKESAFGLGCTTWEVVTKIILPYTRKGVVGGVMLGLGRALGETMAVTFVIGNATRWPDSLFAPGASIASTLANEFGEASGYHVSALFALGLLLFVITMVVLTLAKWLLLNSKNEH